MVEICSVVTEKKIFLKASMYVAVISPQNSALHLNKPISTSKALPTEMAKEEKKLPDIMSCR